MNTIRSFSTVSRCSLAALLLASVAPVGCVGASEDTDEDFGVEDDAITSDAVYRVQGVQSGKCVGISSASRNDGAGVDQSTCAGSAQQQWKFHQVGSGVFTLAAQHSGKCLDIALNATSNGAKVQQMPCDGAADKQWKVTSLGNGEYKLAAQHSGKCLDVKDNATSNGADLQQWACGGGANQRFRLTRVTAAPSGNPLAGSTFFVDSKNQVVAEEAKTRASGNTRDADLLKKISTRAQGVWIADWSGDPRAAVSDVLRRAGSAVPVLVAYNIPNRDCGNFSSGGAASAAAYRTWIDGFAEGIGNAKVAVVLEPDALAMWVDPGHHCASGTPELLDYAVKSLKKHANTHVYIDAGTSSWNSAANTASGLTRAGIAAADGFALNTSFTASTSRSTTFGHAVSDALGGKVPFVIDTSRNGNGEPADSAWCNARGRALGTPATTNTGDARIHALLWVKRPGQSDGECNRNEPAAGQWFQSIALELARNASF